MEKLTRLTVGALQRALAPYAEDTLIVLSSDSEGNRFGIPSQVDEGQLNGETVVVLYPTWEHLELD